MPAVVGSSQGMKIERVGEIRSCFGEKFGTPRQPGICPSGWGELRFDDQFRRPEMVRELEGFSHIWLVFGFNRNEGGEWSPTVRPPRLGGNRRVGVWASRSPFRPNSLGLSLARLERVARDPRGGPLLQLGGIDLVDHTPVFDIKPYLPYCEALPDALGGFALTPPDRVAVVVDEGVREAFDALPERSRQVIREVLACDPRPAAGSGGEGRVFGVRMCGHDLRFVMAAGECRVVGIKRSDASGLSEPPICG